MGSIPSPAIEISRKGLSLAEQNIKAAFGHARELVRATDLQEAMQIQLKFLKNQITNAAEQMKQIADGIASAAKDATKGKFKIGASS